LKTNYVLIDYENVQPAAIAVLDQEHFKIIVQHAVDLGAQLQQHEAIQDL
jgi:hypothetical protein